MNSSKATVAAMSRATRARGFSIGYRLAPEAAADASREVLLALPLPGPHRALGPMPVQTALETLAGPAFRLVEDPVHRLVTFERCGAIGSGSL